MTVRYTIAWTHPRERLYDIAIRFTAPDNDPLLWLPAWRPGRYLLQNYAANVREWSANLRKVGKSEWRAEANAGDEVVVAYRYYAGTLDAGSSYLDDDEAYVNGSNLFMCVDALRGEETTLTFAAPVDWRIETQLPRQDDGLVAWNYDHLIDSPIIAAESMTRLSFVESGARIHFIVRGPGDFDKYLDPLRSIVRAQAALFGGLPIREYRFLVHVGDRWHGVEHEESSSLIIKRIDDDEHVLSLCSHEFFHAWNVKRIVPAAFTPYDYLHETPTKLLWAMEGITSYFGDLMLVHAGVWSETEYLDHLRKEIEILENAAGRQHLSLAQASFDGWLHDPAHVHDKANAWISFYNKGQIVAALLDLAIRAKTEHSLDDVMRLLWREYGETRRGVPEDGVERAVAAIAGEELARDFFARYVDGTEPLPYAELFGHAAVAFDSAAATKPALGAKLHRSDGRLVIDSVVRGGSAMEAGLLHGDELIAIDGVRTLSADDVDKIFETLDEGAVVDVVHARAGAIATRTMTVLRDPHVTITLRAEGENALRAAWLRRNE